MGGSRDEMIRMAFQQEKEKTNRDVEEIYHKIYESALTKPTSRIMADIIDKESDLIISYINELVFKIKNKSIRLAEQNSCADTSGMIWANVEIQAGVPEAKLCHSEKIVIPHVSDSVHKGDFSSKSKEKVKKIEKLEKERNRFIGTAIAGVAVEAATLLIVPGWEAGAAIAHIAGFVVIGAGVVGSVDRQVKINQVNRLYDEAKDTTKGSATEATARRETEKVVSEICSRQASCNAKILCAWIDQVCEEFLAQIEEYSAQ